MRTANSRATGRKRRIAGLAVWTATGAILAVGMPAACLFPDYSFDEPEPSGAGGSGVTVTSGNNMITTTSASTTTTGAMTTATSGGGSTTASTTVTTTAAGGGEGGMGGGTSVATTSASTTSASSTTSTTGGGGEGGAPLGPEDCLNDVDDNGDAKIDCADPKCTPDYYCVNNVPATWIGYYALYDGPPAMLPSCPDEFPDANPYLGYGGLVAPAATCSACSCGAPTGQTCNPPGALTIGDATCAGSNYCTNSSALVIPPIGQACSSDGVFFAADVTCGPASIDCTNPGTPCNVSLIGGAPFVTGGSCAPAGGVATVVPYTWNSVGQACSNAGVAGLGCGVGKSCVAKTAAPLESNVCIRKAGNNNCPAGQFSEKHLFFDDATDTRGCTGCSCGGVNGGDCQMSVQVYSSSGTCTGQVASFLLPGCADLAGNPQVGARKSTLVQAPSGGSCQQSGGAPTGTATGTTPVTFCCIP